MPCGRAEQQGYWGSNVGTEGQMRSPSRDVHPPCCLPDVKERCRPQLRLWFPSLLRAGTLLWGNTGWLRTAPRGPLITPLKHMVMPMLAFSKASFSYNCVRETLVWMEKEGVFSHIILEMQKKKKKKKQTKPYDWNFFPSQELHLCRDPHSYTPLHMIQYWLKLGWAQNQTKRAYCCAGLKNDINPISSLGQEQDKTSPKLTCPHPLSTYWPDPSMWANCHQEHQDILPPTSHGRGGPWGDISSHQRQVS